MRLSSSQHCCEIAKYAGQPETARRFSRKLKKLVTESTVKSIEEAYVEVLRKRQDRRQKKWQFFLARSELNFRCLIFVGGLER